MDLVCGLNDWQVARWLASVPHPYRFDHAMAYLSRPEHLAVEAALGGDATATLAVAVAHDGSRIYGLGLVPSKRHEGARKLGFWLSRPYWGQGIMPGAVIALIDEVKRQAPNTLIVASTNHDNIRSQRLIRSLGFIEDGHDETYSTPLQRLVTTVCFRRA
jgi:RimJ/RimL family protein N-acetyltransferase